jgi:putative ABC transport system ATP-binding protein
VTGEQVLNLLLELADEIGTTVLMVTHDPAQAERLQRKVELPALASSTEGEA